MIGQYANLLLAARKTGFKPVLPDVVKTGLTQRIFKRLSLTTRRNYERFVVVDT